jgi:hypothetical protein
MIGVAMLAFTILATLALAPAFAWHGRWLEAAVIAGVAVLAAAGQWRGWRHTASLAFVIFVAAAALGLSFGLAKGQAVLAVAASLCMWDLAHYSLRLRALPPDDGRRALDRQHLLRLLIVAVAGVVTGMLASGLRIKIGLGAALALGVLAVVGLSEAIRYLRRQGDG